ncbi:S8 family peptidase [Shivajiella indica]|uniref:S8 family peptidase n=1 Tax=Shivajiella indica TaxID=872115 RepID=A0ABW5BD85_9BACT
MKSLIEKRYSLSIKTTFPILLAYLISSCGVLGPKPSLLVISGDLSPKNSELTLEELSRWNQLDLIQDTIPGMSVDRAYKEIIRRKKGKPIIVAVLDSGIDLLHEDISNVLWKNKGEVPGNNEDDDNNGYIDDIHGYNFLGDAYYEQWEYARILRLGIGDENYQAKAKRKFDSEFEEAMQNIYQMQGMAGMINEADSAVRKELGKNTYTIEDLESLPYENEDLNQKAALLMQILSISDGLDELKGFIDDGVSYYSEQLKYNLNLEFDGRKVVGDDPYDLDDKGYGNGNPQSQLKDESHGTHVAGIIAAERGNKLGINGVANHVEIMGIRAVPDGDEYDKDIAWGIRYAVDNGAKIINASFGKSFSPNPEWVYDAIKYAESKDVLIVLAAGNDGLNLDDPENPNFPNDHKFQIGKKFVDNVITVGALTPFFGTDMIATYSNYGAKTVDIFAPGEQVYSTMPENEYEFQGGTSMAAPAVAGIAALIRSYYPGLSASQVKKIIMESGLAPKLKVSIGEEGMKELSLADLCISGKIANAYNAMLLAKQVHKGKVSM